jgi:hypothetical protein
MGGILGNIFFLEGIARAHQKTSDGGAEQGVFHKDKYPGSSLVYFTTLQWSRPRLAFTGNMIFELTSIRSETRMQFPSVQPVGGFPRPCEKAGAM